MRPNSQIDRPVGYSQVSNQPFSGDGDYFVVTRLYTGTRGGTSLKAWREIIARGGNATTNYSTSYIDDFSLPEVHHFKDYDAINNLTGKLERYWVRQDYFNYAASALDFLGGEVRFPTDTTYLDMATHRMKGKLKSADSQVSALVPIFELKDLGMTVRSIAKIAEKFLLTGIAVKHVLRDPSSAKRYYGSRAPKPEHLVDFLRRELTDAWLLYSFGIKPLVSDVQNIAQAIDTRLKKERHRVTVHAGSRKTWEANYLNPSPLNGVAGNSYFGQRSTHQLDYVYDVGYDTKVYNQLDYKGLIRQQHYGIDLRQLPLVLWEVTPYSWMWDYFTNIGDFLEDHFTSPEGTTSYISLSTVHTFRSEQYVYQRTPSAQPSHSSYIREIPGSVTGGSFTRSALTDLPHIGLNLKTGDQVAKNSVNKILNLISVLLKP